MKDHIKISQEIGMELVRNGQKVQRRRVDGVQKPIIHTLEFDNPFFCEHIRNGKVIGHHRGKNGVTIVGKNDLWDTYFGGGTQIDPWYIGLINQSPAPTLSENDTLAAHAGWAEFSSYSGNRKEWVDAAAASKIKGTTTPAEFTMSGSGDVHGIFVCSVDTGTAGILWATGSFDSSVAVVSTDVLRITYGVRA